MTLRETMRRAAEEAAEKTAQNAKAERQSTQIVESIERVTWLQDETNAKLERLYLRLEQLLSDGEKTSEQLPSAASLPGELKSDLLNLTGLVLEIHQVQRAVAWNLRDLGESNESLLKQKEAEALFFQQLEANLQTAIQSCTEMVAVNSHLTGEYATVMRKELTDQFRSATKEMSLEIEKIREINRQLLGPIKRRLLLMMITVTLVSASVGSLVGGKIVSNNNSGQVEQAINKSFREIAKYMEDSKTLSFLLRKLPPDKREDFLSRLKLEMKMSENGATANPQGQTSPSDNQK